MGELKGFFLFFSLFLIFDSPSYQPIILCFLSNTPFSSFVTSKFSFSFFLVEKSQSYSFKKIPFFTFQDIHNFLHNRIFLIHVITLHRTHSQFFALLIFLTLNFHPLSLLIKTESIFFLPVLLT